MKPAEKPDNEAQRLSMLLDLKLLDTMDERAYDDLTQLAATICGVPISLVSLVDEERQWFKSRHGLDARETPRDMAFCAHAILGDELFCVPDSSKDERFADNPLVTGEPHVQFYAGMPLTLGKDLRVGTLCVIDNKPRELSIEQSRALQSLARQAVSQLELRLKIQELEALDQMKTEFVAMVSHELRTPLTSIYGSLALLRSGALADQKDKSSRLLDAAHSNSQRLIQIVNDILDLTKLESGTFTIDPKAADINNTIEEAMRGLDGYLRECKVKLELDLDPQAGKVVHDNNRMIQMLNNLVSNAAKFSPDGERVHVISRFDPDTLTVLIEVRDHGAGISKEHQRDIFKRFAKFTPSVKGKVGGTGLGLNICRHLVELHNGDIWFKSEEGKGSSFFMRFESAPASPATD